MTITIRTFNESDYPSVRALWLAVGLELNRSDELSELLLTLERDPDLFIVAENTHLIVGAVLARFDGRRGYIYHLAVAPQYQNQEIGTKIMKEVCVRLLGKNCRKINLHVNPDSPEVMRFYKKLGYQHERLLYMTRWIDD